MTLKLFFMKFACSQCMYTYDESIWESSLLIEWGTSFEELWEGFYCPGCSGDKEYFAPVAEEINYPLLYDDLTSLESEHFPIFIDSDDDWVKIQIWEKTHSSNDDHYVSSITLFDEYEDIIEEHILLPTEEAIIEFDVDRSEIYEIRVNCNTHGIWGRKIDHG